MAFTRTRTRADVERMLNLTRDMIADLGAEEAPSSAALAATLRRREAELERQLAED
jgi:hypothetical protein